MSIQSKSSGTLCAYLTMLSAHTSFGRTRLALGGTILQLQLSSVPLSNSQHHQSNSSFKEASSTSRLVPKAVSLAAQCLMQCLMPCLMLCLMQGAVGDQMSKFTLGAFEDVESPQSLVQGSNVVVVTLTNAGQPMEYILEHDVSMDCQAELGE